MSCPCRGRPAAARRHDHVFSSTYASGQPNKLDKTARATRPRRLRCSTSMSPPPRAAPTDHLDTAQHALLTVTAFPREIWRQVRSDRTTRRRNGTRRCAAAPTWSVFSLTTDTPLQQTRPGRPPNRRARVDIAGPHEWHMACRRGATGSKIRTCPPDWKEQNSCAVLPLPSSEPSRSSESLPFLPAPMAARA